MSDPRKGRASLNPLDVYETVEALLGSIAAEVVTIRENVAVLREINEERGRVDPEGEDHA